MIIDPPMDTELGRRIGDSRVPIFQHPSFTHAGSSFTASTSYGLFPLADSFDCCTNMS